jgi:Uma2 family endonuclease
MPVTAEALSNNDVQPSDAELMHADGRRVSEADYWAYYYEFRGARYEWNNGRLEEKRLSDNLTFWIFNWLCALLAEFLKVHPIAQYTGLDHGFRLALPDRVVIRKPDLGLVCSDNLVQLGDLDRSYRGTFDLCIESLSDSDRATRERDEVHKRRDYAQGGVSEYYILHHDPDCLTFLARGSGDDFESIQGSDGIVRSRLLAGFQFRIRDLLGRTPFEALRHDPVYRDFIYPMWQQEEQARRQEEQARQQAEAERDATRTAAVAKLHALGLGPAEIADALDIDRALVTALLKLR